VPDFFTRIGRPARRAIVSAVVVSAVATALVGCSSHAAVTDAAASSSAPTPSTGSATATPTPAGNGFDEPSIYAACDAAVPADLWGPQAPLRPGPIAADSFGLAASDAYAAEHTNGDPKAIYVNVQYFRDGAFQFSALCVASGDPAAPRVEFIRTLD